MCTNALAAHEDIDSSAPPLPQAALIKCSRSMDNGIGGADAKDADIRKCHVQHAMCFQDADHRWIIGPKTAVDQPDIVDFSK